MIHLKDRENLLPKIGTVLKFLVSSSGFMKFKNFGLDLISFSNHYLIEQKFTKLIIFKIF